MHIYVCPNSCQDPDEPATLPRYVVDKHRRGGNPKCFGCLAPMGVIDTHAVPRRATMD